MIIATRIHRAITIAAVLAGTALMAGCASPTVTKTTTTDEKTTTQAPPVASTTTTTTIDQTRP
jgi:uncharacterized lipoprotein YajG